MVPLELPCGRCRGCRVTRAREWALRICHEASTHEANCFLTLTYSDECMPGDRSLHVEDWQKFAKRLRRKAGPFRFFHAGEYDERGRPHYHACVFGLDFFDDRSVLRRDGHRLFTSEVVSKAWPFGFHTIGDLSFASARYVAKYCVKKITGPPAEAHYRGRKPEYATMSLKPGIGAKWFEEFRSDVYPSDQVVLDGRVFRPPRFYDGKLDEAELELLKVKRRRSLDPSEMSEERLKAREQVAIARDEFFSNGR